MGVRIRFDALLLGQQGHLFPWAPVCLACGIGLYFSLMTEPALWILWPLAAVGAVAAVTQGRLGPVCGPLVCVVALVMLGTGLAGLRAHWVAGPVLEFRYYGPIEGRIVGIDRSGSDAVRLTLDRVVLERMNPGRVPTRVRVSLHGDQGFVAPQPGLRIMTTGHLSPPSGAAEPGGFDFSRHAWFQRVGAVGYTRVPVLALSPPEDDLRIFSARMWLSARVQAALPGERGAFAAAIVSGDRSGMGQETLQALRDTNLAHLIAISGLHMGLLAGVVFGGLRAGFALMPRVALRWPVKKIAAIGALIAAAGYLALSGGNVSTERAFIMVAVALGAILVDRRALSLRAVAMAALIVLALRPEALLSPGFQMSFAATTALVAVFGAMRDWRIEGKLPLWMGPAMGVFVSSLVSDVATFPVGAAHFNYMSSYGMVANLISVPLMGVLVMPAAVLAAVLMPFGLDWIGFWIMGLGLEWILTVAHQVQSWSGSVHHLPSPGPAVLPVMALGGLFITIWQGRGRIWGLAPIVLAFVLWVQTERPAVLVAGTGALVGVMTPEGRALSKPRGGGFIARSWLENDGDGADQYLAAERWPASEPLSRSFVWEGGRITHVLGKRGLAAFEGCSPDEVVIFSVAHTGPALPCDHWDVNRLRRDGGLALRIKDGKPQIVTARDHAGSRPWSAR